MISLPSIRLFIEHALSENAEIELDRKQAHYLTGVMRCKSGDLVRLFDGKAGEFLAQLQGTKKSFALVVQHKIKDLERNEGPTLFFAPLKKSAQDLLVEKATELDVAVLQPILTQRTINHRVNQERMYTIAREAAEQCERTMLPLIKEPIKIQTIESTLESISHLFVGDERRDSDAPKLGDCKRRPSSCGILIGPEGGFTPAEFSSLSGLPQTEFISLGQRILRAETAAIAALAVIGQWR